MPGAEGAGPAAVPDRRAEIVAGLRETLPLVIGATPFGLIFGALAVAADFGVWQTLAMSAFVFSGSAQFVAVNLMAAGADLAVIWFATLVINLRHLLYAATLLPGVRHLSLGWRTPLAALLTDETFAVVAARRRDRGDAPHAHWHFLASCLFMWSNWIVWTGVGALLGAAVPSLADWGLEFAMIATFTGIVVPALKTPPFWGAAAAAGIVSVVAAPLPYQTGLLLATAAGVATGLLLERRRLEWRR